MAATPMIWCPTSATPEVDSLRLTAPVPYTTSNRNITCSNRQRSLNSRTATPQNHQSRHRTLRWTPLRPVYITICSVTLLGLWPIRTAPWMLLRTEVVRSRESLRRPLCTPCGIPQIRPCGQLIRWCNWPADSLTFRSTMECERTAEILKRYKSPEF